MYISLLKAISNSQSLQAVCNTCKDVCKHYGFADFSYTTRIPTSLVTPPYLTIESAAAKDQLIFRDKESGFRGRQYLQLKPPVSWGNEKVKEGQPLPLPYSWCKAERFHSISVPVHRYQSDSSVMSFKTHQDEYKTISELDRIMPELHLLVSHADDVIKSHIDFNDCKLKICDLSEREKECLLWIAEGYKTDQVAKKLGVTESTVTFHMYNIRRKLAANNRQHAVAKAIMLGII